MSEQVKMDRETADTLRRIGEIFQIKAPFFSYEEIKMGNVNHTYKLNYIISDENGMAKIKSYLAQKINTVAFTKPRELMSNIDKVTTFIRKKYPNTVTLHFHHQTDGTNFYEAENGFWRLSNYVPSVTFNNGDNPQIVRYAGEAFGNFQNMLNDFDASSLFFTIPHFHDTRKRYEDFKAAVRADRVGRVTDCQEEIDWLLAQEDKACLLTDLYRKGQLPLRVTHNDTKINNVLFDEKTLMPLLVIDLDTVMPGLVGHDFGDAIRFAANFAEEDCEDTSKVGLDLNTFWAFTEGFLSKTAKTLTETEANTLGDSCFSLACELSTRFLADYLNGDVYFKIKNPKHNLTRTRAQIALAKDMKRKENAISAICRSCYEKYR